MPKLNKENVRLALRTTQVQGNLTAAAELCNLASEFLGRAIKADEDVHPEIIVAMDHINSALASMIEAARFMTVRIDVQFEEK